MPATGPSGPPHHGHGHGPDDRTLKQKSRLARKLADRKQQGQQQQGGGGAGGNSSSGEQLHTQSPRGRRGGPGGGPGRGYNNKQGRSECIQRLLSV